MTDYSHWPYKNLQGLREQLAAEESDDVLRRELVAVDKEIALRTVRLVGYWNKREVVEYDRFRTEAEAREAANRMGLPLDCEFELGGKPFKTYVDGPASVDMHPR